MASIAGGQPVVTSGGTVVSGVATWPDLVPVRVLDDGGSGYFEDVLTGLNWVLDNRASYDISAVNMSFGSESTFLDPGELSGSQLATNINDAVVSLRDAGVTVVAAAGNSSDESGLSFPPFWATSSASVPPAPRTPCGIRAIARTWWTWSPRARTSGRRPTIRRRRRRRTA